ncbi:hypothetical protein LTR53_005048 [Teratosphaeriaceae sp. CCFEE 6253]|nr:hypothetical protein LTR53_005048 [Teratosphaeriaceae sp. CCFEE 6253]
MVPSILTKKTFLEWFHSLPGELRNNVYEQDFQALIEELQQRATTGIYEHGSKSNLRLISDALARLSSIGPTGREVYSLWFGTDQEAGYEDHVAALMFNFFTAEDFINYHLTFTDEYPNALGRINLKPSDAAVKAVSGKYPLNTDGAIHRDCICPFPSLPGWATYDDSDDDDDDFDDGSPAYDLRGCAFCELRALLDRHVRDPIRDDDLEVWADFDEWLAWEAAQVDQPSRNAAFDPLFLRRGDALLELRAYRARNAQGRSMGPVAGLSVTGRLGELDWAMYGKIEMFGAVVDVHAVRAFGFRGEEEPKGTVGGKLRRVVRALVLKKVMRKVLRLSAGPVPVGFRKRKRDADDDPNNLGSAFALHRLVNLREFMYIVS